MREEAGSVKRTITEEYDDEGILMKKTIVEEDAEREPVYFFPALCSCTGFYYGSHYCSVHGWVHQSYTSAGQFTKTTDRIEIWNTYHDGHSNIVSTVN